MKEKGNYLGEFEELVLLAVATLQEDAYGVSVMKFIDKEANRKVNISAVHQALKRLQSKGLVNSTVGGATNERGGRSKRFFLLTEMGFNNLQEIIRLKTQLYNNLPNLSFQGT